MDGNCKIEFGDIDSSLRETYFHDDCVQFPTSWPAKDNCGLTFYFNEDLEVDTEKKALSREIPVKKYQETKESSHSDGGTVVCNGIHGDAPPNNISVLTNHNSNSIDKHNGAMEFVDESEFANRHSVTLHSRSLINEPEDISTDESPNTNIQTDEQDSVKHDNHKQSTDEVLPDKTQDDTNEKNPDVDGPVSKDRTPESQDNVSDVSPRGDTESTKQTVSNNQAPAVKTSWAGLFRNTAPHPTSSPMVSSSLLNGHQSQKETAQKTTVKFSTNGSRNGAVSSMAGTMSRHINPNKDEKNARHVSVEEDPDAKLLTDKLWEMKLIYKPQAFIPRGLINISNWCYINATLQALLACPPFFQLLKALPFIPVEKRRVTSTPILDSFIHLAAEFRPLSTKRGYQSSKDVRHGPPFEPRFIYNMLTVIKSTLSEMGRQEDAEEFQTSMLNGLHEEMTRLFKYVDAARPLSASNSLTHDKDAQVELHDRDELANDDSNTSEDEWEEVAKNNRSTVTRRADITRTPISEMFRGELCTSVFRPGQKVSVSLEPFFSLPLDVQSERAWTVDDALLQLTEKESLPDDKSNSDASRQQTLESLPPILIMHLKRFVYDKNGGLKKINKRVDYKTELLINKELLSKTARKLPPSQRNYKLFAVLYHHGEKATGGHYSTDVFHIGVSSWLRIDDQSIRTVTNTDVTRHSATRTAYLLYYRRTDLD